MIFITVGTQLPFDRLIEAVDLWALDNKEQKIFAQIGKTSLKPKNIEYKNFLQPSEVEQYIKNADLIISHAGIGTILTCLSYKKKMIVMPRRAELGEHRNEHQLSTVKHLRTRELLIDVDDEDSLRNVLNDFKIESPKGKVEPENKNKLITFLKSNI